MPIATAIRIQERAQPLRFVPLSAETDDCGVDECGQVPRHRTDEPVRRPPLARASPQA